uniref:Uncharacterized protein n=1 Tax=Arundo donax TaxID=35708 RepID=A0A0A9B8X2_ARUDO
MGDVAYSDLVDVCIALLRGS